ncbi:myelin protein zero-like protein 1 isoform X3 [Gopherus flavomarginatus]|uniref:myelin protein zero-like protein 1 isoform X3 n=1 Tax=Gopherus flavomarginatus TaxID=286002 RepID=UPI0021CC3DFB|nr:myelin protein zero-like protein 1 isoform X3 [Gopherus flavomarginatus]
MGARGGDGRKMAAAAAGGSAGWRVAPALTLAAAALGFLRVSALDVKTPEELFVENGTEARLPCTFSSGEVIGSLASISWSFQPEGATTPISFFYYSQGNAFPGKEAPFKNRISWTGDLNKKDASVSIANVQFRDNGTYFCDVKNPPDIVVKPGEIRLRVVQRVIVSVVDVKTPEELFVEHGTEARLPCTFSSSEVISCATSVSWSVQPEGATTPISFFYYSQGNAFPGKEAPFKNRISWAGDLNKKDASVTIANVQFRDNGTYFCDVKNPPDIVVKPGEIRLRVVQRDNLPAFPTGMVVAIAIGVTLVVLLLIAVIVCVVRKKNSKKHYSGYVLGSFQRGCLDNVLLQTTWLYLFWNLEWHRIE